MTALSQTEVLILAGGLGKRVQHLLNGIPKPMAEFSGKPFLEWSLLLLKKSGFRRIVLSTGYLSEKIKDYFGDGFKWGLDISYVTEPRPLGTGGAIRYSLPKINSNPFVALNGDSILSVDYQDLLRFHLEKQSNITICVKEVADTGRYGQVLIDKDSRVSSFSEKPGKPAAGWINAGIYVIQKEALAQIRIDNHSSFEYDIIPFLLDKGVYAFGSPGEFLDIGSPESFGQAGDFVESLRRKLL